MVLFPYSENHLILLLFIYIATKTNQEAQKPCFKAIKGCCFVVQIKDIVIYLVAGETSRVILDYIKVKISSGMKGWLLLWSERCLLI